VEEELKVELPRGEYDTLGGFISHLLGHVPRQGEMSRFESLLFTVQEADARRVSSIRIGFTEKGS
jgi:magnesium and cobalt transporter